jgi:hypothetical protein
MSGGTVPKLAGSMNGAGGQMPPLSNYGARGAVLRTLFSAQAVLGFNEQLERIAEVAVVLLLGMMLPAAHTSLSRLSGSRCCSSPTDCRRLSRIA